MILVEKLSKLSLKEEIILKIFENVYHPTILKGKQSQNNVTFKELKVKKICYQSLCLFLSNTLCM